MSETKHRIAFVCDFFYPRLGGVEMHQYQLAQCLIERGHKVIIITHAYGERTGVRYLTNGLKVYYCPILPFVDQCSFPTLFGFFPLLRKILIRERIEIVHAHQATSYLGQESMIHAKTMGYKVVYTDHSLFGFSDAACIHINKVLKFILSDIDHAICVSHTNKENLVLRAKLDPYKISVISNAVDTSRFTPDPSARYPFGTINIVVVSRLTFRKGTDLLVGVIPTIAAMFPEVYFIIGGEGPKRQLLEEIKEKHHLHNRMELLGSIPHNEVRNVLVRGHIFLNTSLTEAFCIAIVEAASCGLKIVSTNVGGIPEVLPKHMVNLADPDPIKIIEALTSAIQQAKSTATQEFHEQVKEMYNWRNVAERTEKIYKQLPNGKNPLINRFKKIGGFGPWAGVVGVFIATIDYLFLLILNWWAPQEDVETIPDFPYQTYRENRRKYGDHLFSVFND
jgi:phosphatidylinositol N-acetylglucosaminyltransferase subunit A